MLLLVAMVACFSSCYDTEDNRQICDYNVQLRYDYNEENTSQGVNMIEYYVYEIDEYIFDEAGILFQHNRITPDVCREMMNSELNLPPGRYSVIAIGNMDERSTVFDAATTSRASSNGSSASQLSTFNFQLSTPAVGVTHRDDMRLSLDDAEVLTNDTRGPSERLYHGYRTFTVTERGFSSVRVDMINAHFRLKFRVTWKYGRTPSQSDSYYALLESVPSLYKLMPEYIFPATSTVCTVHNTDTHDEYPSHSNSTIHHIPCVCHEGKNVLIHRYDTGINGDLEMWGEYTNYRILHTTRPMLRIMRAANGTTRTADEQIMSSIDLQAYFDSQGYETTTSLKQHYELNIVVGDRITITPLDIADWDEGGIIQ